MVATYVYLTHTLNTRILRPRLPPCLHFSSRLALAHLNWNIPFCHFEEKSILKIFIVIPVSGYEVGSAVLYGYKDLADIYIPHDIIVVTIQYRLGFLGRICSRNENNAIF